MMDWFTGNIGIVITTLVTLFNIFNMMINFKYTWSLLVFAGFALSADVTFVYHVTHGVKAIQHMEPDFEGYPNGYLWPALFHLIGFIDDKGHAKWFDHPDHKRDWADFSNLLAAF